MMIETKLIKIDSDTSLIKVSPLTVRRSLYKVDDRSAEEVHELLFQVTNISNFNLADLEAEFIYWSATKELKEWNEDFRLEQLKPNETHSFSILFYPFKDYASAELKLAVKKYTLYERITTYFWLAVVTVGLVFFVGGVALIIYSELVSRWGVS